MDNQRLILSLKILLANTIVGTYKAQSYHWNCTGNQFFEAHAFFKGVYDELFIATDIIAEMIRMIDSATPVSLKEILELATVKEDIQVPSNIQAMMMQYRILNTDIIESIHHLITFAESNQLQDVMDLGIERLRVHKKLEWMLNAFGG